MSRYISKFAIANYNKCSVSSTIETMGKLQCTPQNTSETRILDDSEHKHYNNDTHTRPQYWSIVCGYTITITHKQDHNIGRQCAETTITMTHIQDHNTGRQCVGSV